MAPLEIQISTAQEQDRTVCALTRASDSLSRATLPREALKLPRATSSRLLEYSNFSNTHKFADWAIVKSK